MGKSFMLLGGLIAYGAFAFGHLAYHQGASGVVEKGNLDGFWGTVASSVDWCEPNYIDHDQIAEWHNTISSFAIVFAGLLAFATTWWVGCDLRYQIAGLILSVVGLGSVVFHMTLQRDMQALDEVPMLWIATLGCYNILEHNNKKPQHAHLIKYGFLYVLFISCITTFSTGPLAVAAFHLSFFPSEVYFMVGAIKLSMRTENKKAKSILEWSLIFYGLAVITWCTDIVFCSDIQQNLAWGTGKTDYPQLHAYGWHFLVAMATYGLMIGLSADREHNVLGRDVDVCYVLGFVPLLCNSKPEDETAKKRAGRATTRATTPRRRTTSSADSTKSSGSKSRKGTPRPPRGMGRNRSTSRGKRRTQ